MSNPGRNEPVLRYDQGEDRFRIKKTRPGTRCMTFTFQHDFRIGKISQILSLFDTGIGVPWAWHDIKYKLCCNGNETIKFSGSFFPSHKKYINGVSRGMCLQRGLPAFIYAGAGVRAPGGRF